MNVASGLLVIVIVALVVLVHAYAIVHAVHHGKIGMAALLCLFPGLAWFWIPLHRHQAPSSATSD